MDPDQDESSNNDQFQLREIDAQAPHEVLRGETENMPLPLPAQDRAAMQEIIRRKRWGKLTLLELLLLISVVCVLLALTNWVPLQIYALGLGIVTVLLLTGLFDRIVHRYRYPTIAILLFFYLVTAIMLLVRNGI